MARALGIGGRAIARDHLHSRMLQEPLRHGRSRAIREERDGLVALQIDQDRAIRVAFPEREVIHTEHRGGRQRRDWQPPEQAQQGIAAHRQTPALAEAHPGLAPQGEGDGNQALSQPQRAPRPRGGDGRQPLGKDAATAGRVAAEPLADAQLQAHAILRPREIGQGPFIPTVDMARREGAQWTGDAGLRRAHQQRDLGRRGVNVTGGKA